MISSSRVFAAINLFSLSKDEILTLNGVSSIKSSTPVNFSKSEIFLPSLPISFPLNSSLGRSIILEVNSLTVSAAILGSAWEIIIAASFWASSALMVLNFSIYLISSACDSCSTLWKISVFASSGLIFAISESFSFCRAIISSISLCFSIILVFSSSSFSSFWSIFSSLMRRRFWISSILANLWSSIFWALISACSRTDSAFFLASLSISSSVSLALSILAL